MDEVKSKSWWQTLAGMLTAIAALITAITGMLLAFNGMHLIGSDRSPSQSNHGDVHPAGPQPSEGATHPASTPVSNNQPLVRSHVATNVPAVPSDPTPQIVTLPAQREYVVGTKYDAGRYTLLSAELVHRTAESSQLAVRVKITAEGEYPAPFTSSQFALDVEDRPMPVRTSFNDRVPAGESRERELHFIIPTGTKRGIFRIRVAPDHSAEIPLTLYP